MARKKIDGELVATVEVYTGVPAWDHHTDTQAVRELRQFMPETMLWSVRSARAYREPAYMRQFNDLLAGVMLNEAEAETIIERVRAATRR